MHTLCLRQLLMMISFFNLPHIYLDGNQYEEIHIGYLVWRVDVEYV